MTTATLTNYAPYVRAAFEYLDSIVNTRSVAGMWWASMNGATDTSPQSLKSFLSNHDCLNTLQVHFTDGMIARIWSPGVREVDTSHATYATFDGSRRDYAGVVHIAHSSDTWIGFDTTSETVIVHTTE